MVKADASGDKFLDETLAGDAEFLFSSDRHLLSLGPYHCIPIITVRWFLDHLERAASQAETLDT